MQGIHGQFHCVIGGGMCDATIAGFSPIFMSVSSWNLIGLYFSARTLLGPSLSFLLPLLLATHSLFCYLLSITPKSTANSNRGFNNGISSTLHAMETTARPREAGLEKPECRRGFSLPTSAELGPLQTPTARKLCPRLAPSTPSQGVDHKRVRFFKLSVCE